MGQEELCHFKETNNNNNNNDNPKEAASGAGGRRGWHGRQRTQLTEVKSAKPKEEALEGLAEEEGANGSFPLNGSPNPFLFWNGSLLSAPSGWNGSGGSVKSAEPGWFTGVLLPGKFRRKKKKKKKYKLLTRDRTRVLTEEPGASSLGNSILHLERAGIWLVGRTPGGIGMGLRFPLPLSRRLNGFVGGLRKPIQMTLLSPPTTAKIYIIFRKLTCRRVSK